MQNKIDFFIVGAQKAGTSSLSNYLSQHPLLKTHKGLELAYFINDEMHNQISEREMINEYYGNDESLSGKYLLAKNVGVMYSGEALERLYRHNPEVKIIVMLRNPIERAYSAYWYAKRKLWETAPTFEQAIELGPKRFKDDWIKYAHCDYLGRSEYSTDIKNILKFFKRENVYVCFFEEFSKNASGVCKQIFKFCGIDEVTVDATKKHNTRATNKFKFIEYLLKSSPKPIKKISHFFFSGAQLKAMRLKIRTLNSKKIKTVEINPETRKKLENYFQPYKNELEMLLNKKLTNWL